jgi:hypothetical protein
MAANKHINECFSEVEGQKSRQWCDETVEDVKATNLLSLTTLGKTSRNKLVKKMVLIPQNPDTTSTTISWTCDPI